MRQGLVVVAGAAMLAALGCGGQSLGGANVPPSGLGARGGGGGTSGKSSGTAASSGEGGGSTGTAGTQGGEGGASSGSAGGTVGGSSGPTGAGGTIEPRDTALDILFMIDNSSEMEEMQQKLYDQIPVFLNTLMMVTPSPSLHVAVVSSDMGAPSDTDIGCTKVGDQGLFQSSPRGTCTSTTLDPGATFINESGSDMVANYSDQNIGDVLQCIMLLGGNGCGFEHQLASIDHALGADNVVNGAPDPPATNVGFLRDDALLAIIMLTNEDDCSAPAATTLYSLNGGMQNISNPLGPIANYRCNQFGHLCTDPGTGAIIAPPLLPPADAQGTAAAPTLDLTNCTSNDENGMLIPVAKFVSDIRALKTDPDNQIVVSAIIGPPTPYTVAWVPALGGQETQPGELWPWMEHSCGAPGGVNPEATSIATDGSFGDPGVRIAQFVHAFNGQLASVCDDSYASVMTGVVAALTGQ
jgi:hypothetical protein